MTTVLYLSRLLPRSRRVSMERVEFYTVLPKQIFVDTNTLEQTTLREAYDVADAELSLACTGRLALTQLAQGNLRSHLTLHC